MKRNLLRTALTFALISFVLALQAQIKEDPDFNAVAPDPSVITKSMSKLSTDLRKLSDKQVARTLNSSSKVTTELPEDANESSMQFNGNLVMVNVIVQGDAKTAKAELTKLGFQEKATFGRVMSGLVPIDVLPALQSVSSVKFVKPAYKPLTQSNSLSKLSAAKRLALVAAPVYSQGDTAQRSNLARSMYNVNGKGIKVGLLSNSYNYFGGADSGVLKGELPGPGNPFGFVKPVQVLSDFVSPNTNDEGRAMAEIVHDVAPGAELAFHTAATSEPDFALGIIELAEAGCQVIADDVLYFDEPFFQDGIVAQVVDYVKAKGVTYFSSAGNQSLRSYESNYRRSVDTPFGAIYGTAHNFSAPGATARYFQPIRVPRNATVTISFQWDQPFYSAGGAGAENDLNIYLLNSRGSVVDYSDNSNLLSGDPFEFINYTNRTLSDTLYITILKYGGGPDPGRLKYIVFNSGTFIPTNPAIPGINAPTIVGHAKAEGAIATAAVPFFLTPAYRVDTPRVENFSSVGGVANYFDVRGNRIAPLIRRKPEITAPDGGNTSFFFGQEILQDTDRFPNFFGTSAAAPHAAGVAALMIQAQKLQTITPNQIKGVLSSHTVDMDNIYTLGFDRGFDFNTGTGLIKADEAVNEVRFPNQYVKNLTLQALCSDNPAGTRNWKIINPNSFEVSVRWFLTGDQQNGVLSVAPGEYTFSTSTFYLFNRPTPNIVVIEWQDNFGFPHFDIKSSSTAACIKDVVTAAGARQTTEQNVAAQVIEKPNLAEVFPNPSRQNFRVYLSLAKQQNIDLELYTIDGRRLYKKTLQSNGIQDIDASGYKPGVYFLKIRQGEFSKTLKLIRQ